jgi:outer membrane protein OmpA-like peptidoglycan-associated protein
MRRTVVGVALTAAIGLTGAAGCSGSEQAADASRSAADQAASAAQTAGGAVPGATADATDQVQRQIDGLLQANPVVFAPQSAELTSESQQTLEQMAAALKASGAKVTVETHAGYDDAQQAQELSETRAAAVSEALQDAGVAAEKITTNATGNTTAQGEEALKTQFTVAAP